MIRVEVVALDQGYIRVGQRDLMLVMSRDMRYALTVGHSAHKPVTNNRNRIVKRFLAGDADFLLSMDDDVVPLGNPLDYVELDKDILIFPCPIWNYGYSKSKPVVWNIGLINEAGHALDGRIPLRERVIEIAEGGTGCVLIHRRVLEHPAMQDPFEEVVDADGVSEVGHDLAFCRRAREAGFRVWAALDAPCQHYDELDLGVVQKLLQQAEMSAAGKFTAPVVALSEKRMIFCCAPGRCGTAWLAEALEGMEGVWAGHEPEPDFVDVLRIAQREEGAAYRFWLEKKLPFIASLEEPIYVETSHLFNKGFVIPLLNMGLLPDLIVLRRPHREVALSMWRRRTIPGRDKTEERYHVQPDDPTCLVPAWQWEHWTDYQVCYWYCLEMQARAQRYSALFRSRGARVCETTMAEVTTAEGLARLVRQLELGDPPAEVPGEAINATAERFRNHLPSEDLEEMEAGVREGVGGMME